MKKYIKGLFTLLITCLFILAGCSNNSNDSKEETSNKGVKQKKSENVLNMSSTADIPTMDPSLATDKVAFTNFNQTLEGLYSLDKNNQPVPAIAKDEPKKSNNNKTWTIKLRDNAKWSNGDPVTAHDFVYSWKRTVNPETGAEFAYMLENIENASAINKGEKDVNELGVKAIDDYTLEIKLEKDVPWMQGLLAFGTFMPQNEKFVKEKGKKFGTTDEDTLSNGPFKLTEWKTEDSWKLEKNKNYWNKDKVKLETVNYKVIKEVQTGVNMYETGKLDMVSLDAQNVNKYKKRKDFSTDTLSTIYYFKLNKTKNKDLENKNLRLAFSKSIDKNAYEKTLLNNGAKPSNTLVVKDFIKNSKGEDYADKVKSPLNYDSKEAKEYYKKAKKELGKDNFEIEFLTYDQDESKKAAEYVKEQVEKNLPGLKLKIKQQPFKQKLALESKEDFDITFGGWGPTFSDPTAYLNLFLSNSPNNNTGFDSKSYDDALKKANSDELVKEKNKDKRLAILQNAESELLNEASVTPLYQKGAARLSQPYIKNWQPQKYGGDYSLKEVEIKGAK